MTTTLLVITMCSLLLRSCQAQCSIAYPTNHAWVTIPFDLADAPVTLNNAVTIPGFQFDCEAQARTLDVNAFIRCSPDGANYDDCDRNDNVDSVVTDSTLNVYNLNLVAHYSSYFVAEV